jgi:hypothetical protein
MADGRYPKTDEKMFFFIGIELSFISHKPTEVPLAL